MRTLKNVLAAVLFIWASIGITACGNGGNSNNGLDTTTQKMDTVVNPADNTNIKQSDSTLPAGAVGVDTVGGGKSSSSGIKDTSKRK